MRAFALACLLASLSTAGASFAEEPEKGKSTPAQGAARAGRAVVQDIKQAGRAIRDSKAGRAVTEAGKEVGRSSAELGRDVGHAAAEGGREVARVSTQAAREVRRVTVDFWDGLLEGKRRRVTELEKENRELKKKRDREP